MRTKEMEEREWEISKQLDEIRIQQEECDSLQRELARLEEDSYWQNKRVKEVNDDMFDSYPNDAKLQNLLAEKEELLQKKLSFEKGFFEDCRELISRQRKETENLKEEYEVELLSLHKKEGEGKDEDYIYADTN